MILWWSIYMVSHYHIEEMTSSFPFWLINNTVRAEKCVKFIYLVIMRSHLKQPWREKHTFLNFYLSTTVPWISCISSTWRKRQEVCSNQSRCFWCKLLAAMLFSVLVYCMFIFYCLWKLMCWCPYIGNFIYVYWVVTE